jgi:hypothetical protein
VTSAEVMGSARIANRYTNAEVSLIAALIKQRRDHHPGA